MSDAHAALFAAELQALRDRGLDRTTDDPTVGVDLTSNDYLGLARDPRVVAAAIESLRAEGAGAGAARLLAGPLPSHRRAESAAARWLDAEDALLLPSGYQANAALIGALAGRGDLVLSDALNHASLIDAIRATRAAVEVHAHLDLAELDARLGRATGARRRLVVTEGVFSMDGDAAPIGELCELCARHDAWLVVDEAHSVGLLGPRGAGAVAQAAAMGADTERVLARVVTGGKALGAAGAFVVGSRALREIVVNHGRAFLFTTATPPAVAAALEAAIEIAAGDDERRARCLEAARRLAHGLGLRTPDAAIVPWIIGGNQRTVALADRLRAAGYGVRAVRSPTVPPGTERLRLVGHAHNEAAELDRFIDLARGEAAEARPAPPATPRAVEATRGGAWIVAGTDTGVGKTVLSALALRAAARSGPAGYWKPVQTGDDDDTAEVRRLARDAGLDLTFPEPLARFPLPASPHEAAAEVGQEVPVGELTPGLERLRAQPPERRWIVELAGGLMVPYRLDALQIDWLAELRLPVLLAARSSLGTLNHTLLSVRALERAGVELRALFLIGAPHRSNRETLRALSGAADVFEVPPFEELGAEPIEAWLETARSHRGLSLPSIFAERPDRA